LNRKESEPVKEKVEVMKRIACTGIGLVLTLGLLGLTAAAQAQSSSGQSSSGQSSAGKSSTSSSDSSLGDYAKQIRKSTSGTKPKVYDNDNLPVNDKLSIVGAPAEASADNSADSTAAPASGDVKSASGAEPKPAAVSDEEKAAANKQWAGKLSGQQDQVDLLSRELDVLQREYQIRAAAMYADAGNRMRNAADWDKQDAQYKQQIADKQKALDDAKQKLDDMQEEARKAGVPSSVREQSTPAAPAQ
jgi:hypothetical protein